MSKTPVTFGPHGQLVPPKPQPKPATPPPLPAAEKPAEKLTDKADEPDRPVAVVTGAGRGIGRATAVELSRRGYAVVLIARTESQLNETAALCGGAALVLPLDVRDAVAITAAVATVLQHFGRIDALVNNAGLAPLGPFLDTAGQYDDVLATNLGATVRSTHAVWPTFLAAGRGVVVNVSSESARDPFPGFSIYAAAKGAINAFTKALAKEAEPRGVRVHCVAPAGVETRMLRAIATTEQVPTESTLSPEAVARVIAACVVGDLAATSGETIYLHK